MKYGEDRYFVVSSYKVGTASGQSENARKVPGEWKLGKGGMIDEAICKQCDLKVMGLVGLVRVESFRTYMYRTDETLLACAT